MMTLGKRPYIFAGKVNLSGKGRVSLANYTGGKCDQVVCQIQADHLSCASLRDADRQRPVPAAQVQDVSVAEVEIRPNALPPIMVLNDLLAKVLLVLARPMIEFAFTSNTG